MGVSMEWQIDKITTAIIYIAAVSRIFSNLGE